MKMLDRIDRVIRRCRETITTAQFWNDNRTDESPLDCEVERVSLAGALRFRRALLAGDTAAAKREIDAIAELLEGDA